MSYEATTTVPTASSHGSAGRRGSAPKAVASSSRMRDGLERLVTRGLGVDEFARDVSRIIRRSIPFDGVSVLTMDPATGLATKAFVENGLQGGAAVRIAEIEYLEPDVNKFDALASSGRIAASLSAATGGNLRQSRRHRELRAPHGFGDELRTVLVTEEVLWGSVTLGRTSELHSFTPAEVELMASISSILAEGLRHAVVLAPPPGKSSDDEADEDQNLAGIALVARDNTILRADAAGTAWLKELRAAEPDVPLPSVMAAVAIRARGAAGHRGPPSVLARARTRSGTWLTVRGSVLGGDEDAPTAITLEPARPHELAPLLADAYELTPRERRVVWLVAQGLDTDAIAAHLFISPWTVQDHLKSIFEKVGVNSRGELTARLYLDRTAPRLNPRDLP